MRRGSPHRHARGVGRPRERGAALVEMSMVVGLLALFLFGIVTFGVTLSFKQSLDQAGNEAARAAAVAPRELAVDRAASAVDRVASAQGVSCDDGGGLTCSFVIAPCAGGASATVECMTVELRYDLDGHPRVPTVPLVDRAIPDELVTTVVVQVNELTGAP